MLNKHLLGDLSIMNCPRFCSGESLPILPLLFFAKFPFPLFKTLQTPLIERFILAAMSEVDRFA
jgi:hypothetical protein